MVRATDRSTWFDGLDILSGAVASIRPRVATCRN